MGTGIVDTLDQGLPLCVLVYFVEDQEIHIRAPLLIHDIPSMRAVVPVQVQKSIKTGCNHLCQRSLANLAGTAYKHHLLLKILHHWSRQIARVKRFHEYLRKFDVSSNIIAIIMEYNVFLS